jgi:hypothetical protein
LPLIMTARTFTCPDCLHVTKDYDLAGLGWCEFCSEYTGRCGAGRRLWVPGFVDGDGWQMPCTRPWTALWELARRDREPLLVRLCDEHGRDVRAGRSPLHGREVTVPAARGG